MLFLHFSVSEQTRYYVSISELEKCQIFEPGQSKASCLYPRRVESNFSSNYQQESEEV